MEKPNITNILSDLPLMFERNIGQHNRKVQFILSQKECTTFFTDTELVLGFKRDESICKLKDLDVTSILNKDINRLHKYKVDVLRISLENSNKVPQIIGKKEFNCKLNYFKGNTREDWRNNVPIYEKLLYKEIYSGIDLLYFGERGSIKLSFIIKPNKSIDKIKLNFEGADNISLDESGNLLVKINNKVLKLLRLEAFQKFSENKIECNFEIEDNFKVKFNIKDYNSEEELIITFPFIFETYNLEALFDRINSITVDDNKCIYITGVKSIQEFPEKLTYKRNYLSKDYNAYFIKIDTRKSGQASLIYGAYLGGNGSDEGISIAIDNNEIVYIAGNTNSTSGFPTTEKSYLYSYPGGESTGFLIKIDPKEFGVNSLCYGTYLGGEENDCIHSLALDQSENVYVVGDTISKNIILEARNSYNSNNYSISKSGFLISLNTRIKGKGSLIYGTYFYGSNDDSFYSVALDYKDYVYITGVTKSDDFPITDNAYEKNKVGKLNSAFLLKFDINKSLEESLIYSSYLNGNGNDIGYSVIVDSNECAYITGVTDSSEGFPITEYGIQTNLPNDKESGFLVKIDTKESGDGSLIYGSYLGGNGVDICSDIEIDCNKYIYISGFSSSKDLNFKSDNYENNILNQVVYSFLLKVDLNRKVEESILKQIYLGQSEYNFALSVAIDNDLNAYIAGNSYSIINNKFQSIESSYKRESTFLSNINTRNCDLILEKDSCKCYFEIGDITEYTINIKNNGPDIARNVIITDLLQKGLIVKRADATRGKVYQIGNKLIWTIEKIKPCEKLSIRIIVRVAIEGEDLSSDLKVNMDDNFNSCRSEINEINMYRYLIK